MCTGVFRVFHVFRNLSSQLVREQSECVREQSASLSCGAMLSGHLAAVHSVLIKYLAIMLVNTVPLGN